MLNAYGIAMYPKFSDDQVWTGMCEPQKTGAKYMTEYASEDPVRRGVAISRWLQPLVEYCRHQKTDTVCTQNKYIMQEKLQRDLYEEIDRILPALEYCLAPKKVMEKKGASMRRSSREQSTSAEASAANGPVELGEYA